MDFKPLVTLLAVVNPLAAYNSLVTRLFSTHPSTAERIARLDRMATAMHEVTAPASNSP